MFGFENSPTIDEQKQRLSTEIDMREALSDMENSIEGSATDKIFSFVGMIRALIFLLTVRIKDCRTLKSKQEYGQEKLRERAGPDWKSS